MKNLNVKLCLFAIISVSNLSFGLPLKADVRLPGFFGDHMVLQQEMKLKIWGWSDPNENVEVTLGENAAKTSADADGKWQVELPSMKANSNGIVLKVVGNNTIEIKDVLIGEVWLCSGQSNMEWTVQRSSNAAEEIAAAKYPLIRHIKFDRKPSNVPVEDIESTWEVCSPETAASFTACGYYMARHLHKELNVPIGLVNSSWGGTRVEPWTPPNGFEKVDALSDIYSSVLGRTPGTTQYQAALEAHIQKTQDWIAVAKNFDGTESVPASPAFPASLAAFKSHQDPTMLYNGMIHAAVGFPIRGAIWYQGESNHADGMLYFEKKKALINGWRELWQQGDFPFYFVQIAPFKYGNEDPTILAKFWEAQEAVTQLPNTEMVVINDIATLNDIHPPNKQDVGKRLAMLALKNDYGKTDLVANSPTLDSHEAQGKQLMLTFKHTGGGLKTRDEQAPSLFEIIGPNSKGFQAATASIDGDRIVLSSDAVASPTAFRFAWNKLAQPNLTGATGLPVGAFRGGTIPEFSDNIDGFEKFQLVYDLDLSSLGPKITYSVDNSSQIKDDSFDRVGYLVQLDSKKFGPQNIFVSADAFTKKANKIGVPAFSKKISFQSSLTGMSVFSDVKGIGNGTDISTGNIEFWPDNYAPVNGAKIQGASDQAYDFGDVIGAPKNGYGSMQIHNFGNKQTLFAINHWKTGIQADIGIGNNLENGNSDWTFMKNASIYSKKRLRIFVRPK